MTRQVARTTLGALQTMEIIQFSDGYRTKRSEHGPGLPILRAREIEDGRVRLGTSESVREEFRGRIGAKVSTPGDVLITTKGTVGRIARVPGGFPQHVYAPQLCFVRVIDFGRVDPGWLYGWMRSPQFAEQLETYAHQTDMAPYLSLGDLQRFWIDLPSLDVQRRISGVLESLDDLCEADEWLIKALDHHRVSSWLLSSALARDAVPLGDLAILSKGVSYQGKYLSQTGLPMINLANFSRDGSFRPGGLKHYTDDVKAQRLLYKGDLVVANTDLTQSREILAWPVLSPYEKATSTHHTYQVRPVDDDLTIGPWLFGMLRQDSVQKKLVASATGTTVAALPADVLRRLEVPWPRVEIRAAYGQECLAIEEQIIALREEIAQIRAARDELLPLLMSGRVTPGEVA